MAINQALALKNLKDILFTEKEITKHVEREHIFEIKDKHENLLGFISSHDLKNFVFEHSDEDCDYYVKNIDSSEWASIFTHPSFQRRRPQLLSSANLGQDSDHQFFVLENGQKKGPFEKNELLVMLEKKEILLTDLVTINSGLTWMKLFQVDNFERRVLKESDQLPGIPNQKIMANNDSVTSLIPATDAISSLAYLSNINRGKSVERDRAKSLKSEPSVQRSTSAIYKWLLVGSIIGIIYFGFHLKNQLASPFKSDKKSIGEQAEMLTPVEKLENQAPSQSNPSAMKNIGEKRNINQVNDSQRNTNKFKARVLQPIRPAIKKSFMDTSKYQNTIIDAAPEDPNYFYDNTSAMELDPVRSQVSKENFDNSASEAEEPIPANDNLFENEIPANSN